MVTINYDSYKKDYDPYGEYNSTGRAPWDDLFDFSKYSKSKMRIEIIEYEIVGRTK